MVSEHFLCSPDRDPNGPRDMVYFIVMHPLYSNGLQVIFSALSLSHLAPPDTPGWLIHAKHSRPKAVKSNKKKRNTNLKEINYTFSYE